MHAYINAHGRPYNQYISYESSPHACMHTYTHMYTHIQHTHIIIQHTEAYIGTHAHTHAHTHTLAHKHIHTYKHIPTRFIILFIGY